MDNSTYRHLFSKIKKSGALPHHNYPSHNLLSAGNLVEVSHDLNSEIPSDPSQFLANIPFYQQFPYAVYRSFPLFYGSGDIDEAFESVKKKLKWQRDLNSLRAIDIDKAIKQLRNLRQKKVVKITHNLRNYISHFHADPEPSFEGKYNWLYTDGTLSYIDDYDGPILISSDSFGKKPGFNLLKLNENLDGVEFKFTSRLKTFSPVLQIESKSNRENLFVCTRQKGMSTLYRIRERDYLEQPRKVWKKKVASPKLITCIGMKADCEEVLIADSSQDLHVFDVESAKKVFGVVGRRIKPDSIRDGWSQVAFGDRGVYFAIRNCFVVLDPRDVHSKMKLEYDPSPAVNDCEEICSFVQSSIDSNFVYLGTTHSVLQVDLRSGENVQKWTHMMKKPPQFITRESDGGTGEILVLQSEDVNELSGITNERMQNGDSVNFLSRSLPCLLSNIEESLRVARFHSVCLSPSIAQRFSFAVTGMQCVKNKSGDYNIYTSNSAGDVFLSKMEKKRENRFPGQEDEEEMVNAMKMYETHVEKISFQRSLQPQLELSDMSGVLQELNRAGSTRKRQNSSEVFWKFQESFAPESLEFCKDLLASRFLKVWGHGTIDRELVETTMSVEEKVREWINRN